MKRKLILILFISFIFSLFMQKSFSANQTQDFLGAYEPYEQFNDKTKHYEAVTTADKLESLTFNQNSLQYGNSSCKDVTYHVIPRELMNSKEFDQMIDQIAKEHHMTQSNVRPIKIKGQQCDLMIIVMNDQYFLLLSQHKLPIIYARKK